MVKKLKTEFGVVEQIDKILSPRTKNKKEVIGIVEKILKDTNKSKDFGDKKIVALEERATKRFFELEEKTEEIYKLEKIIEKFDNNRIGKTASVTFLITGVLLIFGLIK